MLIISNFCILLIRQNYKFPYPVNQTETILNHFVTFYPIFHIYTYFLIGLQIMLFGIFYHILYWKLLVIFYIVIMFANINLMTSLDYM